MGQQPTGSILSGKSKPVIALAMDRDSTHWYAVQTCSRHEKRVAQQLVSRRVETFLPLYVAQRRWADRLARIELPLFSGYLFLRISLTEKLGVLQLPGVVRFVSAGGTALPLLDEEVAALRAGLDAGGRAEPHPFLRVGQKVYVIRGPFAGCAGILLRKKDSLRVVLSLDVVMRSIAVEVDSCDIEPARQS